MKNEESVYLDKNQITINILNIEGCIITSWSKVVQNMKEKKGYREKVENNFDFNDCLNYCHNLYQFIQYNDLQKQRKKVPEVEKLIEVMEKYESYEDEPISYYDLQTSVRVLREIVSKCGYHDNALTNTDMKDESEDLL